jgi:hypothetical protein
MVFSANDFKSVPNGLPSVWSSVCRNRLDCASRRDQCTLPPQQPYTLDCTLSPLTRVRLLSEMGFNLAQDANRCHTLAKVQIVSLGAESQTNACPVGAIVYASILGLYGFPGYYATTEAMRDTNYLLSDKNVCPHCDVPVSRCSDGPSGVGCCYGTVPCQCPPRRTGKVCGESCSSPGITRCNLQGDCNSGTVVNAQNVVIPWSVHDCECTIGFFGQRCERTCVPSCSDRGKCVLPNSNPLCLCEPDWAGAACDHSIAPCTSSVGDTTTLCASHGLCTVAK